MVPSTLQYDTFKRNYQFSRYKILLNLLGKTINEGIEKFKSLNSSSEPFNPHELWLSFKNILQQLQHISYRRSVLKLDDVSPALKQLKGTRIPMPGVGGDKTTAPSLFIQSVENHVLVLPTKTKPKKFLFVGTDGKRYIYYTIF